MKDKNNRKIKQGDIILSGGTIGIAKRWKLKNGKPGSWAMSLVHQPGWWYLNKDCEIIGTEKKNPEILNDPKFN